MGVTDPDVENSLKNSTLNGVVEYSANNIMPRLSSFYEYFRNPNIRIGSSVDFILKLI